MFSGISGFNHLTLVVDDLDQAFVFYTQVLGLKPLARRKNKSVYLLAGDDWIALVLGEAQSPALTGSYQHLALSVRPEDFSETSRRILESGAKVWQENSSPGESLYFLDSSGNKLEIHVGNWQTRLEWLRQNPSPDVELF